MYYLLVIVHLMWPESRLQSHTEWSRVAMPIESCLQAANIAPALYAERHDDPALEFPPRVEVACIHERHFAEWAAHVLGAPL